MTAKMNKNKMVMIRMFNTFFKEKTMHWNTALETEITNNVKENTCLAEGKFFTSQVAHGADTY